MDLTNRRCGRCGAKAFAKRNIRGFWDAPWMDFPCVHVSQDLMLWVCSNCGETAGTAGDAEATDDAVEASIRDQVMQFIDIIVTSSGLEQREIERRLGFRHADFTRLQDGTITPTFQIFNFLKLVALDPKAMMERLDPRLPIADSQSRFTRKVFDRIQLAQRHGVQHGTIACAKTDGEYLEVMNCAFSTHVIKFSDHPILQRIPEHERRDFEIALDGNYIHWARADVHLDFDGLRRVCPRCGDGEFAPPKVCGRCNGKGTLD